MADYNCTKCYCVVARKHADDHRAVCLGSAMRDPQRMVDIVSAAKQEWMDEAMKRVASALRGASRQFHDENPTLSRKWRGEGEIAADALLSPPPPKAPSVPEVRWSRVAEGWNVTTCDGADLQAFARAVVSGAVVISPGGKA